MKDLTRTQDFALKAVGANVGFSIDYETLDELKKSGWIWYYIVTWADGSWYWGFMLSPKAEAAGYTQRLLSPASLHR